MVDSTVMQSGRYKAYPEYKDSGVEWLGEIPPHWKISKLRYMFDFGSGLNITKANLQDTGIPCISYGEIHSKFGFEVDTERHDLKFVDEKYLVSNPSALLNKGDLVFADTSEDIEGSGNFTQLLSDKPAFAGYHTVIVRPKNDDCSRFYAYLMDSKEIRTQIRYIVKGVKVFTISQSILKGVSIWLPSSEERQAIANFLDYETAKIDTLIEKQQRLIELLTEKRQAVISHAVTKGLNPDVPMKDSGVEWLGEVPEHWEVSKAKYVSNVFVPQRNKPELNDTKGLPWITMEDMKTDYITDAYRFVTLNALKHSGSRVLQAGAVIASCVGNFGVTSINKVDVIINQQLQAFIPLNIKAEYLKAIVSLSKEYFELIGTSATLVYVNKEGFENLPILIPTPKEQSAICEFINKEIQRFNKLISKAEHAIQLMQERRTALISAAVTGKIDVRDWVKPE